MNGLLAQLRRWMLMILVMLVMLVAGTGLAHAQAQRLEQALDLATDQSALVAIIPSLEELNQKINQLLEGQGVPTTPLSDPLSRLRDLSSMGKRLSAVAGPEAPDQVKQMRENLSLVENLMSFRTGIKPDGMMVVIVTPTPAPAQADAPAAETAKMKEQVISFLPVSGYKAFLENLKDATTQGPITSGTAPSGGRVFVKQVGDYAAISSDPTDKELAAYRPAKKGVTWLKTLKGQGNKTLSAGHMVVMIDPTRMPDPTKDMAQAFNAASTHTNPALEKAAQLMIREAYASMSMIGLSLDFNDKGIGAVMDVQFKPESQLGQALARSTPAADHMARLIADRYVASSATSLDGLNIVHFTDRFNMLATTAPNDPMMQAIKPLAEAFKNVKNVSQTFYASGDGTGNPMLESPFATVTVVHTSDAAGFVAANRAYVEGLSKVKLVPPDAVGDAAVTPDNAPGNNPDQPRRQRPARPGARRTTGPQPGQIISSYQSAVEKINGLDVDRYTIEMGLPPEVMRGPLGPIMMMVGAGKQTGYVVQEGDYVLMVSSKDKAIITQALAALKQTNGLGNDKLIVQLRQQALPEKPAMEGYLNVANLATMFNGLLELFNIPTLNPPANLPPVSAGMSIQEGNVLGRIYLPTPVISFIRESQQQLINAPPPGAPAPGGEAPTNRPGRNRPAPTR